MNTHSRVILGDSQRVAGVVVRPLARMEVVELLPYLGLTWLRPAGVQLQHPDGSVELLRVWDRTRWLQIGLTLMITWIGWKILNVTR